MMSFVEAINTCLFKKYATIKGRASRAEFWWLQLLQDICLLLFLLSIVIPDIGRSGNNEVLECIGVIMTLALGIILCALIIPGFSVQIRRLHDTGNTGWILLWTLIPYVGILGNFYIFWLYLKKGDKGENEYGPDPCATMDQAVCPVRDADTRALPEQGMQTEEVTNVEI